MYGAFVALIVVCGQAHATCNDAYYNSTRSSRINSIVSAASPGSVFILSDSHGEAGLEIAYGQGSQTIGGHPVVFLGSAGATWATFRDCFPWSAIAGKSPSDIVIQGNVNDTVTGQCCGGQTVNADATLAYAQTIMGAINNARAIVPNPIIATDPPPESASGIDARTNHQSARMVYYVATLCGGTCTWADLGWQGSAPSSALPFVDQYKLMAGSTCNGADQAYSTPCRAAVGATRDNVHWPHSGIVTMFSNIEGVY